MKTVKDLKLPLSLSAFGCRKIIDSDTWVHLGLNVAIDLHGCHNSGVASEQNIHTPQIITHVCVST